VSTPAYVFLIDEAGGKLYRCPLRTQPAVNSREPSRLYLLLDDAEPVVASPSTLPPVAKITSVRKTSPALTLEALCSYLLAYPDATLSATAEHFFYHPNTISGFVRKRCGKSFSQFCKELRMETAARLLTESSLSVSQIAQQCGYHNISHFYNCFRERYGKTPAEYRRACEIP